MQDDTSESCADKAGTKETPDSVMTMQEEDWMTINNLILVKIKPKIQRISINHLRHIKNSVLHMAPVLKIYVVSWALKKQTAQ